MTSFNTGSVLDHDQGARAGGFPISIPDQIAARMAESMRFVDMSKGEAVAVDSFEPHMSGPNMTATPRLAMKIAYAEGTGKTLYLARTDALEGPCMEQTPRSQAPFGVCSMRGRCGWDGGEPGT